jgi:hypothetical protein
LSEDFARFLPKKEKRIHIPKEPNSFFPSSFDRHVVASSSPFRVWRFFHGYARVENFLEKFGFCFLEVIEFIYQSCFCTLLLLLLRVCCQFHMLFASSRAQIVTIDFLGFLYRRCKLSSFEIDLFLGRVGWGGLGE